MSCWAPRPSAGTTSTADTSSSWRAITSCPVATACGSAARSGRYRATRRSSSASTPPISPTSPSVRRSGARSSSTSPPTPATTRTWRSSARSGGCRSGRREPSSTAATSRWGRAGSTRPPPRAPGAPPPPARPSPATWRSGSTLRSAPSTSRWATPSTTSCDARTRRRLARRPPPGRRRPCRARPSAPAATGAGDRGWPAGRDRRARLGLPLRSPEAPLQRAHERHRDLRGARGRARRDSGGALRPRDRRALRRVGGALRRQGEGSRLAGRALAGLRELRGAAGLPGPSGRRRARPRRAAGRRALGDADPARAQPRLARAPRAHPRVHRQPGRGRARRDAVAQRARCLRELPAAERRRRRRRPRAPVQAIHGARGRRPVKLPRLRPSLFELKIAGALVLAALVPLAAALWLARPLTAENLAMALNPRVVERLETTPALYGDLFQARKQLYAEQARALLRQLPADPERWPAYLAQAVERTPRLRRAAVVDADGEVLAEAEASQPNAEGEWRPAPARVAIPPRRGLAAGAQLECTFAVEARFFAELSEARDLAEVYHSAEALRADIQRSYVRAFAGLLGAWALAAGLLGALLARRTTRRLSDLVRAVRELARGDLSVQVDPGRARDELAARYAAAQLPDPAFARLLADAGEIVREEVGTLQRLVQEFSEFAKLPEVRPEQSELGDFVEEFVRTNPQLAAEAELQVARGGACPVSLDRALMRRALTNLVRNAIEVSQPERAHVHLGICRMRDRAVLTVADEGPGIPEELRERIFDPYFTTRHEGTGLGLAIVKKIVLQHGGEIAAGAHPGGGATFAISLPLEEGVPPSSQPPG